jgi:PST family polysaccharide transporter
VSDSAAAPLRHRALRAMGWTLGGQTAQQVLRLGVMIAMSRLLIPQDFGLVSMVATITGFATVFTEAGIAGALIQRKVLTREHIASAAWLTLVLGALFAGVTAAASPAIAAFYSRHALQALTFGFAADFLLNAPGVVPAALLARQMRFGRLITAELVGVVVGGAVAISQAAIRPSPWPVITFLLVSDGVTSLLLMVAAPYPVALRPQRAALSDLWAFSGGQLGYSMFNYWSRNADNLLIGKVIGSVALGIYSRCYLILLFPVQHVAQVVNRVMFPAMATVQDDHRRIRSAYLRTVAVVGILVFPATAWLFAAAHPIVIGLLGEQWRPAIPVLRVFAVVAAIQSIGTTTGWLYQVTGHTQRMFRVTVGLTVLVIAGFAIGVQWGLMGVVYSYLIWNCISLPANVVFGGRGISLPLSAVLAAIAAPFLMAAALAGALAAVGAALTGLPEVLRLLILGAAAVILYAVEIRVVQPRAWTHLRSAMRDMRTRPPAELEAALA